MNLPQPIGEVLHSLPAGPVAAAVLGLALLAAGLAADIWLLLRLRARRPDWQAVAQRLRLAPWTWNDALRILAVLLGAYTLMLAVGRLAGWATDDPAAAPPALAVVVQTLLFHGSAGIVLAVTCISRRRRRPCPLDAAAPSPRRDTARALCYYVAAFPAVVLSALAWRLLLQRLGFPPDVQGATTLFTHPSYPAALRLYMGVFAVAVAPVVEEVCFRGMLLPLLARRLHPLAAAASGSALFAAVHFHVPSAVPLFVISMAFSLAYLFTGRLRVCIAMHAVFNAVSIGALLLLRDWVQA